MVVQDEIKIVDEIKSGGTRRLRALKDIYNSARLKTQVNRYVLRNGGSREDAQDIFQEAVIAFDRNIRLNKFKGESKLEGYFYSIAKYLWINLSRKKDRHGFTKEISDWDEATVSDPETLYINSELQESLHGILMQLGEKCQQVLKWWKMSYTFKEIAEKMDLKTDATARKLKHSCYHKLLSLLEEKPELVQKISLI